MSNLVLLWTSAAVSVSIPHPSVLPLRILLQTKQQIKRLRRQQSNRESARRSRQRKAEEANMLAHRVGEMEVMNGALQTKNATLETEVQQLRSIIDMMASDSSALAAQVGPATQPLYSNACLKAVRHFLRAATYQQCSCWWEIQNLMQVPGCVVCHLQAVTCGSIFQPCLKCVPHFMSCPCPPSVLQVGELGGTVSAEIMANVNWLVAARGNWSGNTPHSAAGAEHGA
jgi:plant G-box-binding factor